MENKELLRFYLNARHSTKKSTGDDVHPHTWELSLRVTKSGNEHPELNVESVVDSLLNRYDNQLLNDIPPFNMLTPTTENLGKVLYRELKEVLDRNGVLLDTLEISETPTKVYIINQYETIYQDIRKEVEEELQRYKKEVSNRSEETTDTDRKIGKHKDLASAPPPSNHNKQTHSLLEHQTGEEASRTERKYIRATKRNSMLLFMACSILAVLFTGFIVHESIQTGNVIQKGLINQTGAR